MSIHHGQPKLAGVAYGTRCRLIAWRGSLLQPLITHFMYTMRLPNLIIDHTDRERDQRKLVQSSLTINTTYRSSSEIICTIKKGTFLFVIFANITAKSMCQFWGCNHNKIIPSNMTNKVIGITILSHNSLTYSSYQSNHIIAGQEAIGIIKSLKIIEIKIE